MIGLFQETDTGVRRYLYGQMKIALRLVRLSLGLESAKRKLSLSLSLQKHKLKGRCSNSFSGSITNQAVQENVSSVG